MLLKAVDTVNGNRSGVHMIRRSRKEFDNFILSLIHGSEIKHYEIVYADDKYGIKNGPKFDNLKELLEFYKTSQVWEIDSSLLMWNSWLSKRKNVVEYRRMSRERISKHFQVKS